ncbi:MAG TPA: cyclic peptide export ABC transporter [Ruminiclostridium sp.]|nr:cyclic peptide export ABC transporter [Ruminiclostridium sp.]
MVSDGFFVAVLCVSAVIFLITLFYIAVSIKEICMKERRFEGKGFKGFFNFVMSLLLMGGFGYCLYNVPQILFYGATWNTIEKIGPENVEKIVICLVFVIAVLYLYFLLTSYFSKPNDKPYFMVITLSIISGLGNSIVVFIINQALGLFTGDGDKWAAIESRLYIYLICGIVIFTVSSMIVRKKLILVTNNIIYDKRMKIIDKILRAPYIKFSSLEDGNIYAALNNDTETIGNFVGFFVAAISGIITLITCFIYLGILDKRGTLFFLGVLVVSIGLYQVAIRGAEKFFEKNRNYQTTFFKNITDLVNGFKELYINTCKRTGFRTDIEDSCRAYRDTRIAGDYKFVNVSILGEILYTGVVGGIVFTFPALFNMEISTMQNFVLVLLYMGGIVNQALFAIVPTCMRVIVSWKRINSFADSISADEEYKETATKSNESNLMIEFRGVKFSYKNENGESFSVGPIDYTFKFGEIVFVMGGNGSGKSTLAKLLTGLYLPDEGEVLINGIKVDSRELGEYFSAVYSDYHLFEKLYGIEYKDKINDIEKYLKILGIDTKVEITDGEFSTIKLSSGQRKRLALLISYLEDRPAYLFDEWASDQDPEFRKFFYKTLLPELKARGKAVIAITHDDKYFDEADRLIKMEMGKIVSSIISVNMETSAI